MASLQDRRAWISGGAAAAVLIIAAGWFLLVGPELSSASSLRNQAANTRAQNDVLAINVNALQSESAQLPQLKQQLTDELAKLPPATGLPTYNRQLVAEAADFNVSIQSISVGGVAPVIAAAAPASAVPSATTSTPATTTTTAPAATTGPVTVSVTVVTTGGLANQLKFVHAIQHLGPRTALVNSTEFASSGQVASIDPASTMTAQLTLFANPQTPDQLAALDKLVGQNLGN